MLLRPTAEGSGSSSTWGAGGSPFTPAELRVLPLLATHLTLEGIAERLGVRRSTVKTHVVGIYRKLDVSTRTQAIERAEARGFLPQNPSVPSRAGRPGGS